jgi:hypothetical protein
VASPPALYGASAIQRGEALRLELLRHIVVIEKISTTKLSIPSSRCQTPPPQVFREERIMDRTSIFTLAGQTVYGLVVRHTAETRFRMWSDEWSTLSIGQGQTIEVDFAGAWEEEMLVATITPLDTGYTWVSLVKPIIERSRKSVGRLLQGVG